MLLCITESLKWFDPCVHINNQLWELQITYITHVLLLKIPLYKKNKAVKIWSWWESLLHLKDGWLIFLGSCRTQAVTGVSKQQCLSSLSQQECSLIYLFIQQLLLSRQPNLVVISRKSQGLINGRSSHLLKGYIGTSLICCLLGRWLIKTAASKSSWLKHHCPTNSQLSKQMRPMALPVFSNMSGSLLLRWGTRTFTRPASMHGSLTAAAGHRDKYIIHKSWIIPAVWFKSKLSIQF